MTKHVTIARFLSIFLVGLALAPALAHLLELPNKIALPAEDYRTVQQIYRGWALLGIVVFSAVLSTLATWIVLRKARLPHAGTLLALVCLLAAQAVFWIWTYPANQQTENWTVLPDAWRALRAQWEYSHAAGAVLNLIAFVALLAAALRARPG